MSFTVDRSDCVRDARTSYSGITTRHSVTHYEEHTNFTREQKTELCTHIKNCDGCGNCKITPRHLHIINNCRGEVDCKLYKALNTKRQKPALNKQLFTQEAS